MNRDGIEQEYERLGLEMGWRFITCPERNLYTAPIALITLQPAGETPHGPEWSCEEGSAYEIESWEGKPIGRHILQVQIQRLCEMLNIAPADLFSAHYVPFRSPSWEIMPRKKEALAFSHQLWAWAFSRMVARTVICLGNKARLETAKLTGATLEMRLPSKWGNTFIYRYKTIDGRTLIGLPHLSRYQLFSRPVSEDAVRNFLYS